MQIMGKDPCDGVEIGEVAIVKDAIVAELNGRETHCGHEIIGLGSGDQRPGDVHLHMGLGNDRGELLVFRIDREALQPIGRFGKKHGVEAHPYEVVTEGAGVHAVIVALEPPPGLLIVVNLMFGSTPFSLRFPLVPKLIFVEDVAVLFGPISQSFASGSVDGAETGQLPEVLRELRDFR